MTIHYSIPKDTVCLVKERAKIDFQTPLLEKKTVKELEINVVQKLDVDPKNIFRHIKKLVGEKVEKDDLLAEKKGLFSTKKFFSPTGGVIREIDHNLGIIIISTTGKEKNKILSPFKGEVEKVSKDSLQIKIGKGEEFVVKNPSSDFGGEVIYFDPSSTQSVSEVSKKIVLTDNITSYLQVKTEAMGAKGFVTLDKLPEKTDLPSASLKNPEDFKKIRKLDYPYCTIAVQSAKIYFYQ